MKQNDNENDMSVENGKVKKIGEIKAELAVTKDDELQGFIDFYASDDRSGVIKLVESANKKLDKYKAMSKRRAKNPESSISIFIRVQVMTHSSRHICCRQQ